MGGERPRARVGQRLAADRVARAAQRRQHRQQRAVGAGAHQQPVRRRREPAPPEPGERRLPVLPRAAEALVAEQVHQVGRHRRQAVPHAPEQLRVLGLGRQVHGEVDQRRAARGRRAGAAPPRRRRRRPPGHHRALAHPRRDEAAPLRLHVAAGHGGEVQPQRVGEPALRRQPVAGREAAAAEVVRHGVGDGAVMRPAEPGEVGCPAVHGRAFPVEAARCGQSQN